MDPGAFSISLYEASIPVFLRYLDRLIGLIDVAEAHVLAHRLDALDVLEARLAPDMLPLRTQVVISANFALRASFPLAGRAIPADAEFAPTFDGLRSHVSRAVALLRSLPPSDFEGAESRVIESRAGHALVTLQAPAFLFQYALPNFFFHLAMAFALLRSLGVAIGKEHFDGFHDYRPVA